MTSFDCIEFLSRLPPGGARADIEAQFSESRDGILSKLQWGVWYAVESMRRRDDMTWVNTTDVGECRTCGRVTVGGQCTTAHIPKVTTEALDHGNGTVG